MEGGKKEFFLFIPENQWFLLLTIFNYSSVWHHRPKGSCWVSGNVCVWLGRLHPCSWILFGGTFLGCQQRFIPGSIITHWDHGGGGGGDRSIDAVILFLPRLLTFHNITLQNNSVSPIQTVFSKPNRTPDNPSHPSWRQLSHKLPVSFKEISHMLQRVYGSLSANRVDVKLVPAVFF